MVYDKEEKKTLPTIRIYTYRRVYMLYGYSGKSAAMTDKSLVALTQHAMYISILPVSSQTILPSIPSISLSSPSKKINISIWR